MNRIWIVLLMLCLLVGGVWRAGATAAQEAAAEARAPAAVGDTTRVSLRSDGSQANHDSFNPALSADGRFVAFASLADNLVSNDTNGVVDIFVRDRQTGQTSRVSVTSGGGQTNFDSFAPAISDDGRYVAFCSYATNLVGADTNNVVDVFIHDRQNATTDLVSRNVFGTPGNDVSCNPAGNLVDAIGPDVSADGRFIVFESFASDLIGNDNNGAADIFRYDRQTGGMTRISVDSNGAEANGDSFQPTISSEGLRIAFASDASNLVTGDGNGYTDVFLRNLSTGNTRRVSVHSNGAEGNGDSYEPELSDDGLYVVFVSYASNLVSGDTNSYLDVFIRDRTLDQTSLVSVSSGGVQPNVPESTMEPSVSANGRYVVFQSYAANLASGESDTSTRDVFLRDRQAGTTRYVSISTGGQIGNQSSREPVLSANAFHVAFSSKADNLVGGDTNGDRDIFMHQLQAAPPPPPPPPPPAATLTVNFLGGKPGSTFGFSGTNFEEGQAVAIYINGYSAGTVTADNDGDIAFGIDTDLATVAGAHYVFATGGDQQADAVFFVSADAPSLPPPGVSPIFGVPAGSGHPLHIWLPVGFQE